MWHTKSLFFIALMMTLLFSACEKPMGEDGSPDDKTETDDGAKIVFGVSNVELTAFDDAPDKARSKVGVDEVCTRISLAIFDGDDKIKSVNQSADTKDFGTISVVLQPGTYRLVVIAHNGAGAATISKPEEIKFKDNKVTDTFYYYGLFTVDGNASYDLELKRAVAMFRLVVEDDTPAEVKQMKFYYTGGSSTFDAVTGCGCVNSRQTELRDVPASAHDAASQYDVYTFPHADKKVLEMKVSALDGEDNVVLEREFANVPVEKNRITRYSGVFFGESPGDGRSFAFHVDDEWTYDNHEY